MNRAKSISLVDPNALTPNPKNRNKHPKDQIDRLCDIMRYQGFRIPVIVSTRSGHVVSGHGRLLAAKELGLETIPVIYQDFDSEEQEYAAGISDNAIAFWAELDLSSINVDVPDLGPDFDVNLLGIRDFELEPADKYGDKDADETPPLPQESRVKSGDLYVLGNHRLLCGDSTDSACISRLMNGEKADMVFTDPPYNLASHKMKQGLIDTRGDSYGKLVNCEWDKNFDINKVFPSIEQIVSDTCSVYICTSHFLFGDIHKWMATFFDFAGYCVWSKPNPTPSLSKKHWAWSTELINYGTMNKHIFNYPEQGNALSCWNLPKSVSNDLHPTQKPIHVPEYAIKHSSNENSLIVDLFLGSGSTLIACEKTNRRCFGMEIDPLYCQVILDRWEKYTGQQPKREDGRLWQEIKNGNIEKDGKTTKTILRKRRKTD